MGQLAMTSNSFLVSSIVSQSRFISRADGQFDLILSRDVANRLGVGLQRVNYYTREDGAAVRWHVSRGVIGFYCEKKPEVISLAAMHIDAVRLLINGIEERALRQNQESKGEM